MHRYIYTVYAQIYLSQNPMDIFYTNDFQEQLRERLFEKVRSKVSSGDEIQIILGRDYDESMFAPERSNAWPFVAFETNFPVQIPARDVNEVVRTLVNEKNPWFALCQMNGQRGKHSNNHTFLVVLPAKLKKQLGELLDGSFVQHLDYLRENLIDKIQDGQAKTPQRQCLAVVTACYVQCKLMQSNKALFGEVKDWPLAIKNDLETITGADQPKHDNAKRIRIKQLELLKASKVIEEYPEWVTSEERTPLATHTPDRDGERDVTAVVSPVDIVETISPECHNDEQNGSHETDNESDQPHRKKLRFDNTEVREHNGSGDMDTAVSLLLLHSGALLQAQ